MQRRDYIIIQKVISEINIGQGMLGDISLQDFLRDEKLKRAVEWWRRMVRYRKDRIIMNWRKLEARNDSYYRKMKKVKKMGIG